MFNFQVSVATKPGYRGRLAPSPTGYLHLGHARTFWVAQERARANGGTLVLRNEDLDRTRCKPEFVSAMIEDLRWFGFEWQEGPDCGGPFAPYNQSERIQFYRAALEKLRSRWIYLSLHLFAQGHPAGRHRARMRKTKSRFIRELAGQKVTSGK